MLKCFRRNNRKPQRIRFAACTALGLYLLTLFAVPMLHTHGCEHAVQTCCHDHPAPDSKHVPVPDSDDSCPVCEFAHHVISFFMISEPLIGQTNSVDEVWVTISIPSVAHATALPPCRAPPVV